MQPFVVELQGATIAGGQTEGVTPVLAVHGVTSNHRAWSFLDQAMPHVELIAPDLRGRGGSTRHDGHTGMVTHAEDLVRLLDHFGIERTPVVGHSMGGFVALVLAHRYPDRVSRIILVDGGMPLGAPEFPSAGSIDDVIKPIAARLDLVFDSREEAVSMWRAHPAFADDWNDEIREYAEYDLDLVEPRSRVSLDAVRGDSEDLGQASSVLSRAVEGLSHPTTWLVAPRGLLNETPGLYPAAAVEFWQKQLPEVKTVRVDDVNHYTIVMSKRGAAAVATALTS